MNTNIDHEKIFFNYFLSKPTYLKSIRPGFFKNQDLNLISSYAKNFYLEFGEAPSEAQMKALVNSKEEEVPADIVKSVYEIEIRNYDADWVKRTAEAWVKWKHFDKQLIKTIEYVKTQDVSPSNVEEVVQRAIGMISTEGSVSFDTDVGLDFFNPAHHTQNTSDKLQTGWDFINSLGGGYDPKSLIVYAGEQNVGKSIWLANDAANFVRMGNNVVFVTAEMAAEKVVKRIGSNLLNISMTEYEEKSKNRDFIKRKLGKVKKNYLMKPGSLFIKEYPTSLASVLDIEAYLKELEEVQDQKVHVLVVDYINILSNYRNPNTENTYMKIKQIAEDLRALAVKRNLLVISATQINRGAWDATEIKMENIAESAGLAHTADVIYAIIQDSMMHVNKEYWLKILKIRDGQGKGSRCRFDINYNYMRITETGDIIQ
tara:strand:- start:27896 stop:29182 length:1287 start_codon:yes stop_codon:yes gene_type:complete